MAEILTPDICIIGGGAGGLAVAEAAAGWGASVVLVERGRPGGETYSTGVLPAKVLVAAARHAHLARGGAQFGIQGEEPRVNSRRLHDAIQQTVTAYASEVSPRHLEAQGVQVVAAEARFHDQRTVSAGETLIRARRFVIASGARSVLPEIPGLVSVPYFTTETIFDNTRKLTHLVVIGAGAVGLELAQAYARLGSQVTVVEPGRALPDSDPELAEVALRRLRDEGVDVREGTAVSLVQPRSQGIGIVIGRDEREEMLDASHILVAAGRVPDLEGLDLDKARIRRLRQRPARLELTPGLRTSNRRVFAVGGATGIASAPHQAQQQADMVVRAALFGIPQRPQPHLLAAVTYTDPEIAAVGLSEAAARQRYRDDFVVTRCGFAENLRARAMQEGYGLVKLITTRRGRVLGAGVVGPAAGELVGIFALAIANRLSARDLATFAAAQPTLTEIVRRVGREAARRDAPLARRLLQLGRLLP